MTRRVRVAQGASIVTIALALALVPTGLAAKEGRGPSGGTRGATVTFDPATVVVGQQYQVKVSGLGANAWVTVGARFPYPEATHWCSKWTDGAGNYSCTFTALQAGNIVHDVYQTGNSGKLSLKASATLTISP